MQNILNDVRIFINAGYVPGAFGLILVYGLLNSGFIESFTLLIFVSLQQNNILTYLFDF